MEHKKLLPKKRNKKFLNGIFLLVFLLLVFFFLRPNPTWIQPEILKSTNGVLNVTLNAKSDKVLIGDNVTRSNVWNSKYISDTWEVSGGDTIKVRFENNMTDPTNLHFHGGHVSPKGNSDNVLLMIHPGETFDYEYKIPKNHPPGLYWYHPHLHHYTDNQVMGGMVGAIKVRGNIDELPGIKGIDEKLLVLTTRDDGNRVKRLVNNQVNPTLYIQPFETVRLRVLNASSDDFYNFAIPGRKLNIISRDGNTLSEVQSVSSELMVPGDRIEFLLEAGMWGELDVKSLKYAQGDFTYIEDNFMKIKVSGLPTIPKPIPSKLIAHEDFKNAEIDNTRVLTFSEAGGPDNTVYLLDGKEFDPNVIDQIMTLGTTEEWKLVNETGETHPFHIHINPFQVMSINGKVVDRKGYDDTFPVPGKSTVIMRTKYNDFDGKYVLHCHILFHEDHGMMQVVEVVKPGNATTPDNGLPEREEIGHMEDMNMTGDHNMHDG